MPVTRFLRTRHLQHVKSRTRSVVLRCLVVGIIIGLLPLSGKAVDMRVLQDVRIRSTTLETHITIELDAAVSYEIGHLSQPARLYVDLPDTQLAPNWQRRQVEIDDGRVSTIRIAQNQPQQVRIVLDLQRFDTYLIFAQSSPFRINLVLRGAPPAPAKGATVPQQRPAIASRTVPQKRPAVPSHAPPPTIVIDPGHGGKDPGAMGPHGLQEKTIVLQVAKELREIIQQALPRYRVILTREHDVFIPLQQRAAIANEHQAQLFISLHLNASTRAAADGIETWYLSFAASERAKSRAARENQMSLAQLSDLEVVLRDMHETDRINRSSTLAGTVQAELIRHMGRHYQDISDRGIEGAPFVVLLHTTMPSILVELSFISNPRDAKRLRRRPYRRALAEGVFNGMRQFLQTSVAAIDQEPATIR